MVTTPSRRPTGRRPAQQAASRKPAPRQAATQPAGASRHPAAPRRNFLVARITALWAALERPDGRNTGYYMILGSTLALTAIGLLMVLSASAVEAITDESSSYALFLRQGTWAVGGLCLMFLLARLSVDRLKQLAWPALILAIILLLLVFTPLGVDVYGNRNWIRIGGFSAQPSEAAKLALCIWMAAVLARKGPLLQNWKHALVPVAPAGAIIVGLVLLGKDLGTGLILMLIMAAALFTAGARLRLFAYAFAVAGAGVLVLLLTSGNRMSRISSWLGDCDSTKDSCMQSQHGMMALASGGWWGVGLGQSRQKWNWIPEAHNDFIFAIIGEELGLIGTMVILALFALFAVSLFRVVIGNKDPFVRIVAAGIMAWLVGQAFINIAMVTGLLPVIGVPLPFISYGGSALTFALAAVGVALSFARQTPAARRPARKPARPTPPTPEGNTKRA